MTATQAPKDLWRGYVRAGGRLVHYRQHGQGPAVVLLHDSPRSSRLHVETMRALGDQFTLIALDTPGYGNSDPLGLEQPSIEDFGAALGEALAAMGLTDAPIYATHTSAKIALAYAAAGGKPPLMVLDGVSIPAAPADPAFIAAYMRPFVLDDAGSYLAAEWTRLRDMLRWFPWFRQAPALRINNDMPKAEWIADYAIDLLATGPHYADAYGAAMRHDPSDALRAVAVPTQVIAKSDDVLYRCLDLVPVEANPMLSVTRLSADRGEWLAWLRAALAGAAGNSPSRWMAAEPGETAYIGLPYGQIRLHRSRMGASRPLLILAAPTLLHALAWRDALAGKREVWVPELPGFGESDALPTPQLPHFADALAAMLAAAGAGPVDVLGLGLGGPLALMLASRHGELVASVSLDGLPLGDAAQICPPIAQDMAGGHLHRIWHMLRDGEAQVPWYDGSAAAIRQTMPHLAAADLHPALVGILQQPVHYGDAARAALSQTCSPPSADLALLAFAHDTDPAYPCPANWPDWLATAQKIDRPADIAGAAAALDAALRQLTLAPLEN